MDGQILRIKEQVIQISFSTLAAVIVVFSANARAEKPMSGTDILSDPSAVLELEEEDFADLPPLADPRAPLPGIKPKPGKKSAQTAPATPQIGPVKKGTQKVHTLKPGEKGPAQAEAVTQIPGPVPAKKAVTPLPNPSVLLGNSMANSNPGPSMLLPPPDTNNILFLPDFPSTEPVGAATAQNQMMSGVPNPPQAVAATPVFPPAPTLASPQTLPLVLAPSFFSNGNAASPGSIAAYPARNLAYTAPAVTEKIPVPPSTPMVPMPGVPDIAVILANNQFYPSRIKLKDGMQTRLIFTTINKKPAALVIERLQIQRWIAKEQQDEKPTNENDRIRYEVNREITSSRITEVVLDPKTGAYSFHDAMSGATGEITVE